MSTPEQTAQPGPGVEYSTPASTPEFSVSPKIDPDNPPWGVLQALMTWIMSVALLLFVPPLFSLLYLFYHYHNLGRLNRETLIADKRFIFFNILGVIPAHAIMFAVIWGVATRFGKLPFRRVMGWGWGTRFGFWYSAGLALVLLATGLFLLDQFGGQPTEMERIILSSRLNAYTTAFLATATAPLVEELIYRGVLYSALQQALGAGGAVLIVMTLFTLVHVPEYWPNMGALSAILLLSLVLTLVRALSGRLLPCFVIHLIFNGVQSVVIVIGPYLPEVERALHQRTAGAMVVNSFLYLR